LERDRAVVEGASYNTRIQKGGALVEEMRRLVRIGLLNKAGASKSLDVRGRVLPAEP
jgi:hypothetical protein